MKNGHLFRYEKLKEKYYELRSKNSNIVPAIGCYIIGLAGFLYYKNSIIIETGVIVLLAGLFIELEGTKKKQWVYTDSYYMICNRVPIELALQYLFVGMIVAIYYFFRMQTFAFALL